VKWRVLCQAALLLLVAGFGANQLDERLQALFSVDHITYRQLAGPQWDVKAAPCAQTAAILKQKFTYLGQGVQSYAFLSEDGRYVLKFIKHQRQSSPLWHRMCALVPRVAARAREFKERREGQLRETYRSWKLAYEELPDAAGLVYLHLNSTDGALGATKLVRRDGVGISVQLDRIPFLIQQRAEELRKVLRRLVAREQIPEACQLLDQLVDLLLSDYRRGVADRDQFLMRNTGLCGDRLIHMDVGAFVRNTGARDPAVYLQDLFCKGVRTGRWLATCHPALERHMEERVQREIGPSYAQLHYFERCQICHEPE